MIADHAAGECNVRLVTFGGLWIEDSNGSRIEALGPRRRALAVLAAIAASGARGIARERLLGIFWPESEPDRARNSLKQTLFLLRRELDHADLFAGSGELRVNPKALSSDVTEFLDAQERSDLVPVAELYSGPFLDGVFLRRSSEFDRWVDSERERFSSAATAALRQLAASADHDGNRAEAAKWYARLTAINPADSAATLGLMEALIATGEPASAIKKFRAHEAFLRAELGCEPSPPLVALANDLSTVRNRSRASYERQQPELETLEPSRIVVEADERDSQATANIPLAPAARPQLGRVVILAGAIIALMILTVLYHRANSSVAEAAPAAEKAALIAVAPFRISVPGKWSGFLEEGMVDLLSGALGADDGSVRTVDPGVFLKAWHRAGMDTVTGAGNAIAPGVLVARSVGATRLISGSAIQAGSKIVLTASLIDVVGGQLLGSVRVSGPPDSVAGVVDRLAASLLGLEAGEAPSTAAVLTNSPLAAVRAFLAGRGAYRRGDYARALRFQETALALDSTFALAAGDMGRTAGWVRDDDARTRAYRLAWTSRNRLTGSDRLILSASIGPRYPLPSSQLEWRTAWDRVIETEPERPEGWYEAGDFMFHDPWLGTVDEEDDLKRARSFFAEAVHRAGDYEPAIQHLFQIIAHQGDTAALRSLWAQYADPSRLARAPHAYLHWRIGIALHDSAAADSGWTEIVRGGALPLQWVLMTVQEEGMPLREAERAVKVRLENAMTNDDRADALLARHALAMNEGRFGVAHSALRELLDADGARENAQRIALLDVMYAGMPSTLETTAALAAITRRDVLAREQSEQQRESLTLDRCFLAHWDIWHDRIEEASALAQKLRLAAATFASELWSSEAGICADFVDASRGINERPIDPSRSLVQLDTRMAQGPYMTSSILWDITVVGTGRLWEKAGDTRRAATAMGRRVWFYSMPLLLSTQLYEQGRLAAASGNFRVARRAYAHYLQLRVHPDAPLVPQRDSAISALDRLGSSARGGGIAQGILVK